MTVFNRPSPAQEDVPISTANYLFFQQWIRNASGLVLDQQKEYLLRARLAVVMEREQIATLDDLCHKLRQGTKELQKSVVEAMTTHETLFFRDPVVFTALREILLPLLLRNDRPRPIQIWSAAASTGQEAYSLAILLSEMGCTSQDVCIWATDLSERVLARAAAGVYGEFEIKRGLSQQQRDRYFIADKQAWHIHECLQKMVRFEQMDLRQLTGIRNKFDLILCRNVLIYFDQETKMHVLGKLEAALAKGGYLLLGTTESIGTTGHTLRKHRVGEVCAYMADE